MTALAPRQASLLISLHDVSPLTLPACQQAVALLGELGVPPSALTVLAIPHHEGDVTLDAHAPTIDFLRGLETAGARLVMHGLTHRMVGRAWTPLGFYRAHVFARGQGELCNCAEADTARRLDAGSEILARAGLASATRAFVPPAWLLSTGARRAVAARGFEFYEVFGGIVFRGRRLARRVIGWGSLSGIEAAATAVYADLQSARSGTDTRLAIHPADMARAGQQRAIRRVVSRLLPRMRPQNYTAYLGQVADQ
ncbi:MAG TPA: DUF2334 domain-containing protein [Polyangia bacterium]|nr:DUF2334 domain-containing protein [Polyangia bacterium]